MVPYQCVYAVPKGAFYDQANGIWSWSISSGSFMNVIVERDMLVALPFRWLLHGQCGCRIGEPHRWWLCLWLASSDFPRGWEQLQLSPVTGCIIRTVSVDSRRSDTLPWDCGIPEALASQIKHSRSWASLGTGMDAIGLLVLLFH